MGLSRETSTSVIDGKRNFPEKRSTKRSDGRGGEVRRRATRTQEQIPDSATHPYPSTTSASDVRVS